VSTNNISRTVLEKVLNLLFVVLTYPRHKTYLHTIIIKDAWFLDNVYLVEVMTKQLLEGVQVVGVLVVCVVVSWDDVHSDTIFAESIKKHFTVTVQFFEVDKPTILVVVAEMDYVLDVVLIEVWEENIFVEAFLILYKDIRTSSYTTMSVVQ
jgi:hypothetical protein